MFHGLTLKELARRTWRRVLDHDCLGRAAQLGFYFTLALFPMLIFLLSVLSFLPQAPEIILDWLATVMPREAKSLLEAWISSVVANRHGRLLSLGLLLSLWFASYGTGALMDALNRAYEVEEGRPFWKAQLVAIALTGALCLLVMGGAFVIAFGEKPAAWIVQALKLGNLFGILWLAFSYIVGFIMLAVGIGTMYYIAPNVQQHWQGILPGWLFALCGFLLASFGFSLYLRHAPSYDITYGSLGAFIVLMIWLYFTGLILCVGGEINAEIQRVAGEKIIEKERSEPERKRAHGA
ncbi:MAG TPA: YihY/virulence factor BrkB family protein [Candidatus Eisenbacteria bacterium]|nr:YihY/virulence factor BrkB family protein [Candidatus Eisenbacteria bacterium]